MNMRFVFYFVLFFSLFLNASVYAANPSSKRVTGPSFECSKATKAVEHAICASRKLSALDRELSKAYKAAKAQLKSGSTDETQLR